MVTRPAAETPPAAYATPPPPPQLAPRSSTLSEMTVESEYTCDEDDLAAVADLALY